MDPLQAGGELVDECVALDPATIEFQHTVPFGTYTPFRVGFGGPGLGELALSPEGAGRRFMVSAPQGRL